MTDQAPASNFGAVGLHATAYADEAGKYDIFVSPRSIPNAYCPGYTPAAGAVREGERLPWTRARVAGGHNSRMPALCVYIFNREGRCLLYKEWHRKRGLVGKVRATRGSAARGAGWGGGGNVRRRRVSRDEWASSHGSWNFVT